MNMFLIFISTKRLGVGYGGFNMQMHRPQS